MDIDFNKSADNAAHIIFSKSFYQMLKRVDVASVAIRPATREELSDALALARKTLPIAEDEIVTAIHRRNPGCFRLIHSIEGLSNSAMIAFLPLNGEGAAALVDGRFDGQSPNPEWICNPNESPDAIYIWLVYTPGRMIMGLRLLQEIAQLFPGIPMLTRPANANSGRILKEIGFTSAQALFPASPDWLIVILPTSSMHQKASFRPAIRVQVARTMDDMMKVFAVRSATYIAEQHASYDEEFDGNDFCGTHLLGYVDGDAAGCARIRYFGDFAKLERMAVRQDYRSSRLMFSLAKACIQHCENKGFKRLYAHARADLVPLWGRFGARPIKGRRPFHFSDVEFHELEMDICPSPQAIKFGADPMVTIRPEGDWYRLGPLDRAQFKASDQRRTIIDASVKRFKSNGALTQQVD